MNDCRPDVSPVKNSESLLSDFVLHIAYYPTDMFGTCTV